MNAFVSIIRLNRSKFTKLFDACNSLILDDFMEKKMQANINLKKNVKESVMHKKWRLMEFL